MDIYFVRHGQTHGNAAKRHQHNSSRLTELGKQQALEAAKAVAALNPTHLVVSNRVRALETGMAIAAKTNLIPETTELVAELHRPHNVYGNYHRSAITVTYLWKWFFGNLGGIGDVPEGESYEALRNRIADTKNMLAMYPSDARVVVVSHSVFIAMFVAHTKHHNRLSIWQGFWALAHALTMKNGDITHITYSEDSGWLVE